MDTSPEGERRRAQHLHWLRILAWCVQRDKYSAEPRRVSGGHRGRARIVTLTFYVEAEDYRDADAAVKEIEARRGSSSGPTVGMISGPSHGVSPPPAGDTSGA